MRYDTEQHGDGLRLRLRDRFTFADYPAFRHLCTDIERGGALRIEINVSEMEFLDSSAIGMLLILHDETATRQGKLTIIHPRGQVRRALEIAAAKTLLNIVLGPESEEDHHGG
ncbi:MAG: STAS domain-containing protein [Alphaproteobacteria bacterium]|nr:MAG: STAS domain-containing protein [Alphaproteobacteria bacterium]